MSVYKIRLTADRSQREDALKLMKEKINWTKPSFRHDEFVIEDGGGLWLTGTKAVMGVSNDHDTEVLDEAEELIVVQI